MATRRWVGWRLLRHNSSNEGILVGCFGGEDVTKNGMRFGLYPCPKGPKYPNVEYLWFLY